MKKIITAIIFTSVVVTAYAKEEKKINMPFSECSTQAAELAKKGFNVKKIDIVRSSGLLMYFFETKTDHYSVSCSLISGKSDYDFMSITKQSQAEYKAENDKAEKEKQNKTNELASQIGL